MTDSKLTTIIRQVDNFPALPATVNNVLAVTGNPESTARDLMKAILPDQSMCATIIKIANSAFFGIPHQVSTMERAVVVLGFNEIRNIVLGKAVFTSFQKMPRQKMEEASLFWEHCFTCGIGAKVIAEDLGYSPSEMFIAGLIHDIGKLAMLMSFPQEYILLFELTKPNQYRSILHENEKFTTSHDEIGMRILKRWLFPETLVASCGYHHHPEQAPPELRPLAVIVQMADMLSLLYCSPDGLKPADIETLFIDFLPEFQRTWDDANMPWDPTQIGKWFGMLQEQRKRDQAILDVMMSS
ncbi:MAG: HDOD domain-containing protein [Desulfopila sp.]